MSWKDVDVWEQPQASNSLGLLNSVYYVPHHLRHLLRPRPRPLEDERVLAEQLVVNMDVGRET